MKHIFTILPYLCVILLMTGCHRESPPPLFRIPGIFVYSIVEHNDSLYFSTSGGETFRFPLFSPDTLTRIGKRRFHPLRSLVFRKDGTLLASSYETGVQRVLDDTLVAESHLWRMAWAMKDDPYGNIWLAGRQGVFREQGDTMLRVTDLREAYDIDFFNGFLVVAHRGGITFYDSASTTPDTTYGRGIIFWTLERFDTLLVAGGVQRCLLIRNGHCRSITLDSRYTIPWSAARDSTGTIYLGTQKGLYSLHPPSYNPRCIAYRDTCIKSLCIDRTNRLWVGEYFRRDTGSTSE